MKRLNTIILVVALLCIEIKNFAQTNTWNPDRLFTVAELQDDLAFFRTKLEKVHPNVYAYTAKDSFNLYADSLSKSITAPMTESAFYNVITLMNAKIKDGHTMLLPSQAYTDYYFKEGKFFPFYIFSTGHNMYVNMNCTADTLLTPGTEIVSINGVPVNEIMHQLMQRQIRDGCNETYPLWILNTYFKSYYSFLYGHSDRFTIEYKSSSSIKTTMIPALSNDSIQFYKKLYYQNRITSTPEKQGITLELRDEIKTAVLTIKDFHNDILKDVYKQHFKKTIEAYFETIIDTKTTSLIIDIRNNQGGDIENGIALIAYLFNKPFSIIDEGPSSGAVQPAAKTFDGQLYVLINGGSFSNSGIVSSFLQKNNRAVFIGEETGGNKTILYGNPKSIVLPNTKINCEIASVRYLLRDHFTNDGHGVLPSYKVLQDIDDIIYNNDKAKNVAMELIKKNIKQ